MKHIDKLFKEKVYNHEVAVPDGMWEKIAPIAEDESGKALLWFWFAGILTLLLGGYGIFKMVTANNQTLDPSTLVYEHEINTPSSDLLADNSQLINPTTQKAKEQTNADDYTTSAMNVEIEKTSAKPVEARASILPPTVKSKSISKVVSKSNHSSKPMSISNTIEDITNVKGVPANLVITKSYVNSKGSVIKQSNLSSDLTNEGLLYDIIINSEEKDLNAGTLLRLIEPLESIPLPAFQNQLKKKNRDIIIL